MEHYRTMNVVAQNDCQVYISDKDYVIHWIHLGPEEVLIGV